MTSTRKLVRTLHLTLSLAAGLWLAASGLSGSLLVFRHAIDRAVNPEIFRAQNTGVAAPLDVVVRNAEKAAGAAVFRIRLADRELPVHELWAGCDTCLRVWIDPTTAEVTGVRWADETVGGFLHELHRRMLSGQRGETLVGAGGVALLALASSGLILAFPSRRSVRTALAVERKRGWRRLNWDFHRVVGIVAAPFLIVSAFSGIYFVFHRPFDAVAEWLQPGPAAVTRAVVTRGTRLPLDELVARARREFRSASTTWIMLPTTSNMPVTVRLRQPGERHPNGRTFVSLHPHDGRIVRRVDAFEAPYPQRFLAALYPLHTGAMGGMPHRLLLVVAGMAPVLLLAGGLMMWRIRASRALATERPMPKSGGRPVDDDAPCDQTIAP